MRLRCPQGCGASDLCGHAPVPRRLQPPCRAAHRRAVRRSGSPLQLQDCSHLASPSRNRSEEHTSELQSLMRISYAVFCLKKTKTNNKTHKIRQQKVNSQPRTTTREP